MEAQLTENPEEDLSSHTQEGIKNGNNQVVVRSNGSPSKSQEIEIAGQENVIEDLEAEILEAIGKRVAEERILAPAIPKSIAIRLEDILKKGLPKEEKEKLIKEHTPPSNCVLMDPPKLNEEIKVSVGETSKKRDERIVEKQKKITASLSLMGSAIVDIINNNKKESEDPKLSPTQIALIKKISEAARLLADLQRDETLTRRSLILTAINNSQKEILKSSTADDWLFGQKLNEALKAVKTIERSGKDLKIKPKESKKSKNVKIPPRRQTYKQRMSGGYQNKTYGQYQANKKYRRNPKNRSSPQPQTQTQKKET